jgi:activator of HSP90 ATPase
MKDLVRAYQIDASIVKVWEALATSEGFSAWSQAPAEIPEEEGKTISLWGGDVSGRNVKIIPLKELVQEWLFSGWQKPSLVKFEFALLPDSKLTQVLLTHTGIPDPDFLEINANWDTEVFDLIKNYLE